MADRTIKCKVCGEKKVITLNAAGTVGDALIHLPGWQAVMSHNTGVYFMCPTCYHQVHDLAVNIVRIMGDNNITLESLLQEERPTE